MANIKLLTVFLTKANQNFINLNYSTFQRSNTFLIASTFLIQSRDYTRGNPKPIYQTKPLFALNASSIIHNFKRTLADKGDNQVKAKINEINVQDAKAKASSFFYKSIAYVIYAFEVVLASNELKLIKQLGIKAYYWIYNLFHTHILQNQNVQHALDEVKRTGKITKKT